MSTKLSRYAEGVMEAAWIAALIMTPLFFNKYSSRIFEPDKATLLRTLALIVLAAWLVKLLDTRFSKAQGPGWKERFRQFLKTPIVPLVLAVFLVYSISTVFSVTPRISFWGSYPRLQGWYTTAAYLVMFASLAANLRRRAQVERLITVAILTSLPVSLYAVLQKNGIDPIPWGGDVTQRVASHMGNAIFVGAYLIMAIPLTIGRVINAFRDILKEEHDLARHIARATVYVFIVALQVVALVYSQSRGPLLGILAGAFFLFLLLSLHWRQRWLTITIVGLAALVAAFLIVFNLPDSPLESLRENQYIGRLGRVFETEAGTGLVRVLIWQGAAEMVQPHDPLIYPDGDPDPFNFLRPLIGYGPETMHMAYNPFYPPELAQVEKRNASPDRSHNETWDSVVITGGLGLAAYLGLYAAIFYFGFKWLGLVQTRNQRILFFVLFFGGGIGSAAGFISALGAGYFGVGLPFGVILGLIAYLTIQALLTRRLEPDTKFASARSITLIMLLSAIMAHFVEINFGIAIVSTRTYFWIYSALLLAVGYLLPQADQYQVNDQATPASTTVNSTGSRRGRKRGHAATESQGLSRWLDRTTLLGIGITVLLLMPLFYEYISNMANDTNAFLILWNSLTRVDAQSVSYGVLILVITTWLSASILLASESGSTAEKPWWQRFLVILGAAIVIALLYGLLLSGRLAAMASATITSLDELIAQARDYEGLLLQFYSLLIVLVLGLGSLLPKEWPQRGSGPTLLGPFLAPLILIAALVISSATNWRIIQADITFKMADPFTASGQWQVALELYKRSKELAPDEDYYDLFMGRAYLEYSKTLAEPEEVEAVFEAAQADLERAQQTNPLNPDHTANLARLHSWWATQAGDPQTRYQRGLVSDQYYQSVLQLAPNNARLWDERAILHQTVLDQPEQALELLETSVEIDPAYDWTYALIGDYYTQIARRAQDEAAQAAAYQEAIANYRNAITFAKPGTLRTREGLNYYYALATSYQAMGDLQGLADVLEETLTQTEVQSELWKIYDNLARTYLQLGQIDKALDSAYLALSTAPQTEQERIQSFISQNLEGSSQP